MQIRDLGGCSIRYEGVVYRPPSEALSLIAQATIVCCEFKLTVGKEDKLFRDIAMSEDVSWEEYEKGCASFFKSRGFTDVTLTKKSGDQGADIIATKDGKRYAIQCKCYSEKSVGNDAVQQVIAAKEYYECDCAIVMTSSKFTPAAKELAKSANVKLVPNFKVIKKDGNIQTKTSVPSSRKAADQSVKIGRLVGLIIVAAVLIAVIVILIRFPISDRDNSSEPTVTTQSSEYILPDSDTRYYTESELSDLSDEELRLARNEIYARHGRKFDSEELQEYFGNQSWYEGTIEPSDFEESMLNEYEKANVDAIMAVEAAK